MVGQCQPLLGSPCTLVGLLQMVILYRPTASGSLFIEDHRGPLQGALFSTACRFSTRLAVSAMASMMPLSTAGWRFSPWEMFCANLGDRAPPCIWAKRLSCKQSGPSILCISWLVRMGYVSRRTCACSSLEGPSGEGGLVDIGDSLLALIDASADMVEYWRGSR